MRDDLDYSELDPGIREVVRHLRAVGYNTTDSGDGQSKDFTEPTCVIGQPHVVCVLRSTALLIREAQRLRDILRASFGDQWEVQASWSTEDECPMLFASRPL